MPDLLTYWNIFPKACSKKRHFLPTKDRYSSVRCVILKDKPRASKILRETSFEFVLLGWRWQYKSCCSKTSVAICACFETVYTVAKSVQEPSIIGQYHNLHNCRTTAFKIVCYPPTGRNVLFPTHSQAKLKKILLQSWNFVEFANFSGYEKY